MLAVLLAFNIMNLADRMVLGALIEPIKHDLVLTDTQMGLLAGLAFAAVYSTVGLPIARLADRASRRLIIGISFVVWSAATAACGAAATFWHLACARFGVALGEAGFGPAAQALIADRFAPEQRSGALGVFALGSSVGAVLGMGFGATFADLHGWRLAFFALGGAGVALAGATFLLPADARERPAANRPSIASTIIAFPSSMWPLVFAAAAHLFVTYAMTWNAAFLMRTHGLSLAAAGVWVAVLGGFGGAAGTLLGGWLGNVIARRGGTQSLPKLCALSVTASVPAAIVMYLTPSVELCLIAAGLVAILNFIYQAPTYAAVQSLAPPNARATAAAAMIFVQNLIGMGLGPLAVGLLSDALTPIMFESSLRWALAATILVNLISAALYLLAARAIRKHALA